VYKKIGLLIGVLQLVGCATVPQSPEKEPVVVTPAPAVKPPAPVIVAPAKPAAPAQALPSAPVAAATSGAVTSLVAQARAQYQAKNYQGAIAIAERALRIDRHAPEVYLVLAQSYVQLANTQLALQFVQQGIRYAQAGTALAQSLAQVRDALPKQ
jgi:tetratricopeptide (TPR) repeat protein